MSETANHPVLYGSMGGYSSPGRLLDDPDSPIPGEVDGDASASDMVFLLKYADRAMTFNRACALLL